MRDIHASYYPREDRNAPAKLAIRCSLQLGVFCLGLLEDRDIGVAVLPEHEEILIRSLGILIRSLGLGFVSRQSECSAQLQVCRCTPCEVTHQVVMVDELLKFCCRPVAVMEHEIGFATQIDGE
jgi:hypothetical protein